MKLRNVGGLYLCPQFSSMPGDEFEISDQLEKEVVDYKEEGDKRFISRRKALQLLQDFPNNWEEIVEAPTETTEPVRSVKSRKPRRKTRRSNLS